MFAKVSTNRFRPLMDQDALVETSRSRGALVYKMLEKDHILVAPASFFDTGK
jgi:hypothetical protein